MCLDSFHCNYNSCLSYNCKLLTDNLSIQKHFSIGCSRKKNLLLYKYVNTHKLIYIYFIIQAHTFFHAYTVTHLHTHILLVPLRLTIIVTTSSCSYQNSLEWLPICSFTHICLHQPLWHLIDNIWQSFCGIEKKKRRFMSFLRTKA